MRGYTWLAAAILCASATSVSANQSPYAESLRAGESVSKRLGESLLVQKIYSKNAFDVARLFEQSPQNLGRLFPELRYAKAFVNSEGRRFLHLKISGFGQGEGILVEVLKGLDAYFAADKVLTVDVSFPEAVKMESPLSESAWVKDFGPSLSQVVLQGPLNETFDLARIGFQLEFEIQAVDPAANGDDTLVSAYLRLFSKTPKTRIGDFRGVSDRQMTALEIAGRQSLKAFGQALQNF
jgi:hypothetical protein